MNEVQNLSNQNFRHSERLGTKYKMEFRETPSFDVQEFLELAVDSSQWIFLAPEPHDFTCARGESAVTFVLPRRAVIHATTIKQPYSVAQCLTTCFYHHRTTRAIKILTLLSAARSVRTLYKCVHLLICLPY